MLISTLFSSLSTRPGRSVGHWGLVLGLWLGTLLGALGQTPNGLTVAGGNGPGSGANQLDSPYGVFVDGSGSVYVADQQNNRIQKWAPGASTGTTVAGGNGPGYGGNQLFYPFGVFVDGSGNIYVADFITSRIQKWAPGASSGTTVAGDNFLGSDANQLNGPTGVFVDRSGNIYVVDSNNDRIQKWAPGASTGTTVAGGNGRGPGANQLDTPIGVFVDGSGNVYVADNGNSRIQKWGPGASTGTTVARGNGPGSGANQLSGPTGVSVDGLGNVYMTDLNNHRIQKWAPGASTGTTVAGGNGPGAGANQLDTPIGVFVDGSGNVYVADNGNSRIQKFPPLGPILTNLAATPNPVCAGQPIRFTATIGNLTGSYSYTLSGGGISSQGTSTSAPFSQSVVASGSGSQSYTLTVHTQDGTVAAKTTVEVTSHPDYQPLVDFYNSTNGASWTNNTGWLTNCDPCGWYGVTCSQGRVTSLDLQFNSLKGPIPESLGNLTNLQYLNLSGTSLSGSIPENLGKLTSLKYLNLRNSQLSGSIPASLGKLTNLQELHLQFNDLSGSYPTSLTALCGIAIKEFDGNAGLPDEGSGEGFAAFCATGGIHPDYQPLVALYNATNGAGWRNNTNWLTDNNPCGWYGVTCSGGRVSSLELRNNLLSGSLPASLGQLTYLQTLLLDNNRLSGSIPPELASLTNLESLLLNNNQLTGSIPTRLDPLTNLRYLYLYGNGLTGSVPQSLGNLVSLEYLILDNNRLSGAIPASLGNLTSLQELQLHNNELSGAIPASLGKLTSLRLLYLQNNQLSGCYPASLTALCGIATRDLSGNAGLPDGGSSAGFAAFCATGQGSADFRPTASLSTVCVGGLVSLSTAGGSTYGWTAPAGAQLTGTASSSVVTARLTTAGEQTFTVVVGQGGTCSQTATVSVTATAPVVSITPGGAVLSCATPSVRLQASGGGTYRWEDNSSSATRSISTAGTYSVTVTSGSGCTAVATTTVTGDQTVPTVSLANDGPLSCLKTSVVLTASGGGSDETFSYRFSAGATQGGSGNTATVTTAGVYSVTVIGANGCSATASTTVGSDQTAPTASITASTTLLTDATPSATLTATTGTSLTYGWSTGQTTAAISVSVAGTYSLTLTGVNGCSATASITISRQTPVASFSCASGVAYQVASTPTGNSTLYRYDVNTGSRTTIAPLSVKANAIGFDADGRLWGYDINNQRVIQIGPTGQVNAFAIAHLPASGFNVGELLPGGYLMLYVSNATRYYVVDVNPTHPTYLQLVDPANNYVLQTGPTYGSPLSSALNINDFAYNSATNRLVALTNPSSSSTGFKLVVINPATGSVSYGTMVTGTDIRSETSGYGGQFIGATGSLCVFANDLGKFYRIDLVSGAATLLSNSTQAGNNDGASCPTAVLSYLVSGTVNGLGDNQLNGTNVNGTLQAILYDNTTGQVGAITPVNADGTFSLGATPDHDYTLYLSSLSATVGQSAVPTLGLPGSWTFVGEQLGSGAGSDGTPDGVLVLGLVNAPVTSATFGLQPLTDLTLVLYARPSTVYGNKPISLVVDVLEVGGVDSHGLITVRLSKDSGMSLDFDPTTRSVSNRPVQNGEWNMDATSDENYYILTSRRAIAAGEQLSIGLTGSLRAGATSGVVTVSGVLAGGSGGETKVTNNTDAEKIDYFQQ